MSPWTEERIEQLRGLVASEPKMTAVEIASTMHVSRNVVIGKARRLGLKLPNAGCHNPPGHHRAPEAKREVVKTPRRVTWLSELLGPIKVKPIEIIPVDGPQPRHFSLLDLKQHHCRWPFGEGPYTFCGHDRQVGSSYCPYHDKESKPRQGNWAEPSEKCRALGIRNTRKLYGIRPGDIEQAA